MIPKDLPKLKQMCTAESSCRECPVNPNSKLCQIIYYWSSEKTIGEIIERLEKEIKETIKNAEGK